MSDPFPPVVFTLMLPDEPDATTAVIEVLLTTLKLVAAVPPNFTEFTVTPVPEKLVPVIVTVWPAAAEVGVKEVTVGAGTNVKPDLFAFPPVVVTLTLPEDEPVATTAVIEVLLTTLKLLAAVPLKLTALTTDILETEKLVPVIVTVVPAPAAVGVKELIVGADGAVYVKPI